MFENYMRETKNVSNQVHRTAKSRKDACLSSRYDYDILVRWSLIYIGTFRFIENWFTSFWALRHSILPPYCSSIIHRRRIQCGHCVHRNFNSLCRPDDACLTLVLWCIYSTAISTQWQMLRHSRKNSSSQRLVACSRSSQRLVARYNICCDIN